MGNFLDSPEQAIILESSPEIAHPVGSYINFGHYEQDADSSNGQEPILWRILAYDNDIAIMISEKILDGHRFADTRQAYYRGSELERFLHDDFYYSAFTREENSIIYSFGCFSASEVNTYMSTNNDRIAWHTPYASLKINIDSYGSVNGSGMWWTSSLTNEGFVNLVWANGSLQDSVLTATSENVGVRPGIMIDMQSFMDGDY